ncbi:hypothetical protein [Neobacillus thermocopriae]|uniref:Uncharacterized protein n=1 Tax=Neobacillus thermocopriae TaxID=1215031 RepID=A0A6B3TS68_9BACI|nr:hypothetical protein [Neobacillus thermocopriae]MED3625286.1 hypothetical protein [Neobacillus thermocopriae]MED3715432.1 hypothetical protein [Neobacillus thermocopriae]NEX79854.1 hypothetical protein [Neobacillus thermocopriae]
MAYIIENANILKNNKIILRSFLIDNNRITTIHNRSENYQFIRMNFEQFIMTPTFVVLHSNIPSTNTFQEMKQFMIENFLRKGSTTLLTYIKVIYEDELAAKLKEFKMKLNSSPVDIMIGVRIPIRLVTPSFIRKCKKEKIPAIFVELSGQDELEAVPWGWIKDALFPYNCPLIPVISSLQKKERKTVLLKWKETVIKEKIPAIYEELKENEPLPVKVLNQIGLYPHKGSLLNGTELSYNLYFQSREIKNVDEQTLFHYHGDRLAVTVHRGKIVRAGSKVIFMPGYGEFVEVRKPSFFSL